MNIADLTQITSLESTDSNDFYEAAVLADPDSVEVTFSETAAQLGAIPGYNKNVSEDTVGAFFKEMARYPLLKPEEEIQLAQQVQFLVKIEGLQKRLLSELGRKPTKAEIAKADGMTERQLESRLYQGRAAKRKMIRSNLRLVVSIAKRYLNRGVAFLDLGRGSGIESRRRKV
jgi:hypothetical protein